MGAIELQIDEDPPHPPTTIPIVASIGLRGPGYSPWSSWAGLSGVAKDLRKLPIEERIKLGYVPERLRQPALEQTGSPESVTYYLEMRLIYGLNSYDKRFVNVHQLKEFLDRFPGVAQRAGHFNQPKTVENVQQS